MRSLTLMTAFVASLLFAMQASALEKEKFTMERFEELQAAGEVVLVDIYATWCPTCAEQQEILGEYVANNPDKELHILEVDWDDDKQWVRHFRAPRQSTLLVFVGEEQHWFTVAETRSGEIAGALDAAFEAAAS